MMDPTSQRSIELLEAVARAKIAEKAANDAAREWADARLRLDQIIAAWWAEQ